MAKCDGYSAGKKQWAEMMADGGKVQVRAYARGGAVKKIKPDSVPAKGIAAANIEGDTKMGIGAIGKQKKGQMSTAGAPKKPSIPAAKSVKASGKPGKAGLRGG